MEVPTRLNSSQLVSLDVLCCAHQDGDKTALNQILIQFQPLVIQFAAKFKESYPLSDISDMIQQGLDATMDAARWWKRELGFKFSTYAADCARRRIAHWLNNRKPAHEQLADESQGEIPDREQEERWELLWGELSPIERRLVRRKRPSKTPIIPYTVRQRALMYRELARKHD